MVMEFHLHINTDNEPYNRDVALELAKNLQDIARKLYHGILAGSITDLNGNTIGKYELRRW